jgi:hypothetical protein
VTAVPAWAPWSLVAAGVVLLAPVMAWAGRRWGARARGGLMLASILLGFGEALDPPSKHVVETTEDRRDRDGGAGEPPH